MKNIFRYTAMMVGMAFTMPAMAQDPHFSSYYHAPMLLNPASVGKGVDDWRVMGIYRSQWWGGSGSAVFNTYTAAVEKRVAAGKTGNNHLGIGAYMLSDVSNNGILKNNYFSVGAAYNLSLDGEGKHMIGLGLQGVYANRMIDRSKTEFQSQFGSMGFQRSIPSDDPVNVATKRYWDVNAGATYSRNESSWGYYVGAALFHAANPHDGTTIAGGGYNIIPARVSLQGGFNLGLSASNNIALSSVADFQGEYEVVSVGVIDKIGLGINDVKLRSLNIGLWNRFGDAITPMVGLEFEKMIVSMSYDITTSSIRKLYNNVSSLEIGLGVQLGKTGENRKPVLQY